MWKLCSYNSNILASMLRKFIKLQNAKKNVKKTYLDTSSNGREWWCPSPPKNKLINWGREKKKYFNYTYTYNRLIHFVRVQNGILKKQNKTKLLAWLYTKRSVHLAPSWEHFILPVQHSNKTLTVSSPSECQHVIFQSIFRHVYVIPCLCFIWILSKQGTIM